MASEGKTTDTDFDKDSVKQEIVEESASTMCVDMMCEKILFDDKGYAVEIKGNDGTTYIQTGGIMTDYEDILDDSDADTTDYDEADKFKLKKLLTRLVKGKRPKDEDIVQYGFRRIDDDDCNEPAICVRQEGSKVEKKYGLKKSLDAPVLTDGDEISTNSSHNIEASIGPSRHPRQTDIQRLISLIAPLPSVCTDDDVYDFSNPERGYAVMIVNDRFKGQSNRDGAHLDLSKTKEVTRKLGFRLFNCENETNLTKAETLNLLRRVQQHDHSQCDCFLFMISTHGLEEPNVRANGKLDHALVCADDQFIFTSSILDMFNDDNCPSLRNKPKIFIIQACRGENLDHGGDVFVAFPTRSSDVTDVTRLPSTASGDASAVETKKCFRTKSSVDDIDTKRDPGTGTLKSPEFRVHTAPPPQFYTPKLQQKGGQFSQVPSARCMHMNKIYAPTVATPFAIVDTPSLRCDNDMLVMYAIPEGMFAWRNTSDGSWMIDYLHQVIMAYDMKKPKSLLSLLTKVSAIMSHRTTNTPSSSSMDKKTAIPVIEHKLIKDVIFQQKNTYV